jgi:hypothetical protein
MSGRKYIGPFSSQPVGSSADISRHTLSAAIAATGILGGVAETGLWRISVFHTVDNSGAGGQMQLILKNTGEGNSGAGTFALPPLTVSVAGNQSGSFVMSSNGTADITYEVDFTGVTVGSLAYSVRIVAEQLSAQG